jgi:hypothetical protein
MTLAGKRHKGKRHDCYNSKSDKRILKRYQLSIPNTSGIKFCLKIIPSKNKSPRLIESNNDTSI